MKKTRKLRIISWDYNSPLLIFNAGLFFLLFEKISFSSSVVLKIATSVFPIYLIHSNLQIQRFLWPSLQKLSDSDPLWIKYTFISIMIMMVCVALDKLFAPIYNAIAKISTGSLRNIVFVKLFNFILDYE